MQFNIKLTPAWIPREFNLIADNLSKFLDTDSRGIDFETFKFIQSKFGAFTYDRFADEQNFKVKKFNSKFHCIGSFGVNAFTFNWGHHFNWLCPPVSLIGEVLIHSKRCKAKGVLFIPLWKSSYFWPMLTTNGEYFEHFIKDFLLLDPFYLNYSGTKSVFDGFKFFYSLALLIDFS